MESQTCKQFVLDFCLAVDVASVCDTWEAHVDGTS